jgi:PPOX class probable FMN-dependent enzyme
MNRARDFADIIGSEAELRAVVGEPARRALDKQIDALDEHCRSIIARAPFVLIASSDREGRVDVSPKGDPAGFVQVLDERTLAIPERPGNRRADTFRNVLQNPRVGLLFLVPGRLETLRVNGQALLVRDATLLGRMAVGGKAPQLALVVSVEEAFVHCGKCMLRSRLWDSGSWSAGAQLPSHARCLLDQAKPSQSLEELEASVAQGYRTGLY